MGPKTTEQHSQVEMNSKYRRSETAEIVPQCEPSPTDRILNAAATVFADHGFHGSKISDIAKLANINKAQLYYHVGNKEKIYEMTLVRHFKTLAEHLESALKDCDDPVEGLRGIVRIHTENFKSDDRAPRTVAQEFATGSKHMTPEAYTQYSRIFALTRFFVEKGISEGVLRKVDPDQVNVLLSGILVISLTSASFRENIAKLSRDRPRPIGSLDDTAELALNALLSYLTSKS
jgi:TetR/AcrR family transcriptional regulator